MQPRNWHRINCNFLWFESVLRTCVVLVRVEYTKNYSSSCHSLVIRSTWSVSSEFIRCFHYGCARYLERAVLLFGERKIQLLAREEF